MPEVDGWMAIFLFRYHGEHIVIVGDATFWTSSPSTGHHSCVVSNEKGAKCTESDYSARPYTLIRALEPKRQKTYLQTCAQRRFRSACAFAQADQNLLWAHLVRPGCKVSLHAENEDWLDCTDAQTDLSVSWAHMSEVTLRYSTVFDVL